MALVNYTFAGLGPVSPVYGPTTPVSVKVALDDLLYSPADHQTNTRAQNHEPYAQPTHTKRNKLRKRAGTPYLPPSNPYAQFPQHTNMPPNPYNPQLHTQVYQQNPRVNIQIENQRVHELNPNFDSNGQYVHDSSGDYDYEQRNPGTVPQRPDYRSFENFPPATPSPPSHSSRRYDGNTNANFNYPNNPVTQRPAPSNQQHLQSVNSLNQKPHDRPPGFVKVEANSPGGKTQVHAVLDYDDDDYYEDIPGTGHIQPSVTPLQGPIFLRNGSVPVVPLTSYPTVNNGSFYQIPILWTALSVALGYELQGQVIKGVPCVKRNFQLYCPTAGNTYPLDKINTFIDENKALMKRMYGAFTTPNGGRLKRAPADADLHEEGDSFFRHVRQTNKPSLPDADPDNDSNNTTKKVDTCESKTEVMTPYWALNSAKKLRAIVNTMHFEQAIHQEVCSQQATSRCTNNCGCEQKYKWHRLLAYDPTDDCAGIFMDWFLFPSCCVCRCVVPKDQP